MPLKTRFPYSAFLFDFKDNVETSTHTFWLASNNIYLIKCFLIKFD